ncbi:hypothetical protein SUGI_0763210 [Cryptomeria japonica]|nr:hypothetical protein SUGI_0763210 [Cryptomeria japonica]
MKTRSHDISPVPPTKRPQRNLTTPKALFGWGNPKNEEPLSYTTYHDTIDIPFPPSLLATTFLAGKELKCCYRASEDGFSAKSFHKYCDFKGPCVIVGYTEEGQRFGGFSPEGYRSTDDYYDSFDAFLFYWPQDSDDPEVLLKVGGSGAALFDYARGGPQFGADGLLLGPPMAPVMGGFAGPDTNSGVGDLRLVETCSTPEDIRPRCFCQCVNDIPPRFLQPTNPHQHLRITSAESGFISQCTASNSYSPAYLRMRTWCVLAKDLRGKQGRLPHVGGENADLRAQLASFEFPVSQRSSPAVIVGEWYCPFIFINEVGTPLKSPKNQLMKCPFYKMDLEKFWEEIYSTQGRIGEKNDVVVDKILNVEEALLFGKEAIEEITYDDGSVLFRGVGNQEGKTTGVKLSWPIIARMREDQGRHGSDQGGKDVRVEKSFSGIGKRGRDVRVEKSFSGIGMAGKFAEYCTYLFRFAGEVRRKTKSSSGHPCFYSSICIL